MLASRDLSLATGRQSGDLLNRSTGHHERPRRNCDRLYRMPVYRVAGVGFNRPATRADTTAIWSGPNRHCYWVDWTSAITSVSLYHGNVRRTQQPNWPYKTMYCCHRCKYFCITRPSSLGGGRILRRTLSVRLSVRPSRYRCHR